MLVYSPRVRSKPPSFDGLLWQDSGWVGRTCETSCTRQTLHRAHTVLDIKVHLIWATKYRCPAFGGGSSHRTRDIARSQASAYPAPTPLAMALLLWLRLARSSKSRSEPGPTSVQVATRPLFPSVQVATRPLFRPR